MPSDPVKPSNQVSGASLASVDDAIDMLETSVSLAAGH